MNTIQELVLMVADLAQRIQRHEKEVEPSIAKIKELEERVKQLEEWQEESE